jgi:hypothetical protein
MGESACGCVRVGEWAGTKFGLGGYECDWGAIRAASAPSRDLDPGDRRHANRSADRDSLCVSHPTPTGPRQRPPQLEIAARATTKSTRQQEHHSAKEDCAGASATVGEREWGAGDVRLLRMVCTH